MTAGRSSAFATPAERRAILHRDFRQDLTFWIGSNARTALKVMRLVEEVVRDPFSGIGKPEPLKHQALGRWSRRIDQEHRMVYVVSEDGIYFLLARFHYRS